MRLARLGGLVLAFLALAGLQPGYAPGFRPGFQFLNTGAAQVLWTPLNLGAKLVEWWDPTQGITLGTGSNVASWAGRITGLTVTQATPTQQPTFSATARNGKPGITCVMARSSYLYATSVAGLPTTGQVEVAVAGYVTAGTATIQRAFGYGGTVNGAARMIAVTNASPYFSAADVTGTRFPSTVTWGRVDNLVEASFPAGTGSQSITLIADGVTTTSSLTLAAIGTARTAICADSASGTNTFNGIVQQVFVTSDLTSSEQQKLQGWESWNDGKAGANLPAGHPYKARAPYVSDP